jgi:hypothetical protein
MRVQPQPADNLYHNFTEDFGAKLQNNTVCDVEMLTNVSSEVLTDALQTRVQPQPADDVEANLQNTDRRSVSAARVPQVAGTSPARVPCSTLIPLSRLHCCPRPGDPKLVRPCSHTHTDGTCSQLAVAVCVLSCCAVPLLALWL